MIAGDAPAGDGAAPAIREQQSGSFQPGSLTLDRDEALRYLGYAGQAVDDSLMGRFLELASACETSMRPLWTWASFPAEAGADGVVLDLSGKTLLLPGKSLADHIEGAFGAALLACTLGAECDRECRRLSATSKTDAMLFGSAAAALVEAAANRLEGLVRERMQERKMALTQRFSPGYGDLPLDVQPKLLSALDAERRIGLHANDANMLVPSKSITAVAGIMPATS